MTFVFLRNTLIPMAHVDVEVNERNLPDDEKLEWAREIGYLIVELPDRPLRRCNASYKTRR